MIDNKKQTLRIRAKSNLRKMKLTYINKQTYIQEEHVLNSALRHKFLKLDRFV